MLTPCRDIASYCLCIYIYIPQSLRFHSLSILHTQQKFLLRLKHNINKHLVYRLPVVHRTTPLYYTPTPHNHNHNVDPHQTTLQRLPHSRPSPISGTNILSRQHRTKKVQHTDHPRKSPTPTRTHQRPRTSATRHLPLRVRLTFACIITANKSQSQRHPHDKRQAHCLGTG